MKAAKHHQETLRLIKNLLSTELSPLFLNVIDDSKRHANHKSAMENPDKGHFIVEITLPSVHSMSRISQHRLVYKALDSIMHRIHALNINILPAQS